MDKIGRFIGKWKFLPQKSRYSVGSPPLSCTYTISPHLLNKNYLKFTIQWVNQESQSQSVNYQVDLNGQRHTQKFYGTDVQIVTTFDKQGPFQILKSMTYLKNNNVLLSEGIRKIGEDSNLLIVQMNNYKKEQKIEIYQQYSRIIE